MFHYRDHQHHPDLAAVAPCLPPEIPDDERGLRPPKTPARADVVEAVSRAIKRQGVFDRERRKVMERLKNVGSLQQLETEAKASFEKLLATQPADISRTHLHLLLRDQLRLGKLPVEIRQLAEKSCADPAVREEIRAEVTPRVRELLALPRVGEEDEKKLEHKKEEKQGGGEKEHGSGEKQTGGEKENGAEKQRGGEKQTEQQKRFAVTAVIEKISEVTILARGSVSPVREEEKDGKDEREEKQRGGEKENGAQDIIGEQLKLAAVPRVREGRRAEVTPRIREAWERGKKHRRGEERSIGRQERDEKQRKGKDRSIGRQEREDRQRRGEDRSIGRQEREDTQRRGEDRSIGRQEREDTQRRGEDRSIGRQGDRDVKREKKDGKQRGGGKENLVQEIIGEQLAEKSFAVPRVREGRRAKEPPRICDAQEKGEKKKASGETQRRGGERSIGRHEEKQRRGEERNTGKREREEKKRDRDEKREKKEEKKRGGRGEETKKPWLELKRARLKSPTRQHEMEWI